MIPLEATTRSVAACVPTLHNFSLSDAAEVFVFLAGTSSMLAYGRAFQRDGSLAGLRQIAARCAKIYAVQVSTTTLAVSANRMTTSRREQWKVCGGSRQLMATAGPDVVEVVAFTPRIDALLAFNYDNVTT